MRARRTREERRLTGAVSGSTSRGVVAPRPRDPAPGVHILRRRMRKPSMPRRRAIALPLAVAALGFTAPGAQAGLLFPERGGSPNADKIFTLYLLIFVLALIVFIGVAGALLWAMFKFRARRGAVAAQIHGNTRLEIGWTG